MRLVILDDHLITVEGLVKLLDQEDGIAVVGQATHRNGIFKLLQEGTPDILLIDIDLDGDDGMTCLEDICLRWPGLACLVLTMRADDKAVVRALDVGACGYLTKSASHVEIIRALRVVKDGGHYLQDCVHSAVVRAMRARARRSESGLSEREEEVLALVAQGLTNTAIATQLHISLGTVKSHLTNIYRKLEVTDRTRAVVEASNRGWLHP